MTEASGNGEKKIHFSRPAVDDYNARVALFGISTIVINLDRKDFFIYCWIYSKAVAAKNEKFRMHRTACRSSQHIFTKPRHF